MPANTITTTVSTPVTATIKGWSEKTFANVGACRRAARAALGADTVRGADFELRCREDGRWDWTALELPTQATERATGTLTSEEWLREAVARLHDDVFAEHLGGAELPAFRIARGWPRGSRKAIGQCWSAVSSKDGATEMFISPVLGDADRVNLLHVIAHEMAHMYVGAEHGHKAPFAKLARAIGLVGKLTATTAGEAFVLSTANLLADMPDYPAAEMSADAGKPVKKTYLLKVTCWQCPEVVLRMTMKVVTACQEGPHGAVMCPCCGEEAEVELPG